MARTVNSNCSIQRKSHDCKLFFDSTLPVLIQCEILIIGVLNCLSEALGGATGQQSMDEIVSNQTGA